MINSNNYCTREAAQRLVDAGIVIETERYWAWDESITTEPQLVSKISSAHWDVKIPALSLAEAWRELPEGATLEKVYDVSSCYVDEYERITKNINPTDACIDLLIWLKGKERV
jgi:hypothetical protein